MAPSTMHTMNTMNVASRTLRRSIPALARLGRPFVARCMSMDKGRGPPGPPEPSRLQSAMEYDDLAFDHVRASRMGQVGLLQLVGRKDNYISSDTLTEIIQACVRFGG